MRVSVRLTAGTAPLSPGTTAVIVDVLRATTTLTVAMANGARRVVAVSTPEEALVLRSRETRALCCGEREGRMLPGFDLGNSPAEYTRDAVADRTLVFASTNGSQALIAARASRHRWLASFINAAAVVEALASADQIVIVCAGQLGRFCIEDAALAGLLCERLASRGAGLEGPDAHLARRLAPADAREVRALVQGASHARYLRSLGADFARDVEFCAGLDRIDRAFEV